LLLRLALGLVFLWFGALKLIPDVSPAERLAGATIERLSFGLVAPDVAVVGLLIGRWMRVTLLLLYVQMVGTLTPLLLFTSETFSSFPLVPTLEGQYIIKNAVLIAGGIVLGATVRGGGLTSERGAESGSEATGA
jgi:hypothetical protein